MVGLFKLNVAITISTSRTHLCHRLAINDEPFFSKWLGLFDVNPDHDRSVMPHTPNTISSYRQLHQGPLIMRK